jgi:FkbM family methyltransferase
MAAKMLNFIVRVYRVLFARRIFYRMNKVLYQCSLRGLGILNFENNRVSGEERFIKWLLAGKAGGVVFDVGANVGNYSRKVLQTNSQLTVYAFEPHPQTYTTLVKHVRHPNFTPINAAAGESVGTADLYDYAYDNGSSHASLYQDVIENIHHAPAIPHHVKVVALGEFAKDHQITTIVLLKIDTEGYEFNVLKGIQDFLSAGKIEAIHFEFNEMNVASRVFFRDFWNLMPNYDFYRLLPDNMVKLNNYSPVFCEIYAYQNIVALLKRC